MSSVFPLIVILVPLALIVGLAIFFIRLFKKTSAEDHKLIAEMTSLESMKRHAEWKQARIISVHAELPSRFDTAKRILNLKLEIKDKEDNLKLYSARWRVDTTMLSSLQPDSAIRVKVYNELVFPTIDGAIIYL
jgi:hypothetical protein